ncbi:MAG: K+-dependent Na+/Ca+ exchanger related-protein [Gemmatimonadetes bacterium]|nr:K+-dependent Na+/Ca+ exchanger related-protein [Gemmatimonadota bacterium]
MLLKAVWFCVGLAGLYFGAGWLVRGAARLARSFGVSPLVVGLTVVAFGTSAPELVVSTVAAGRGNGALALGNVVGSNVLNIALILGAAAVVRPLAVRMALVFRESPMLAAAALALPVLGLDGTISRVDAAILLTVFAGYLAFVVRSARLESAAVGEEFREFQAEEAIERRAEPRDSSRLPNVGWTLLGIGTLLVGAQMMVDSAVFFARVLGMSDLVVGLTVVALGTSLPELATSTVAARRGEADIALGNALGSNIFNVFYILAAAALVRPIAVDPALFRFEVPVLIGLSLLFPLLAATRRRIGRLEGGLLLACYAAFTAILLMR